MPRPLHLYDTWERRTRPFAPLAPGRPVGLYTCGPTVYDYQHIGNFRTFMFEDVLKRVLRFNGHDVNHVMNVTDVGHLVSDADEGEDKMEKGARRTGKTAWEVAAYYTESFLEDMRRLNIEDPTVLCKATDHIDEQVAFVADIERNGFAYVTSDGVYFDTSKLDDYGYLARLDVAGLEAGHRVDLGEKRRATDFALWKLTPGGETRQMEWPSPWGRGFPGWHIECSAMAQKYLGDYFDIHCGGEDHIPVHHTNEIAQTEGRLASQPSIPRERRRLANFWMHGYFLLSNDAKMAKSAGGFLRLATLDERGVDPLAYRYLCLTAHYRSQLNFTWEALDAAQTGLDRMRQGFHALPDDGSAPDASLLERFGDEINDDLNLPRALAVAWETLRGNLPPGVKRATLARFDEVFGLGLAAWVPKADDAPVEVKALADARYTARRSKAWADADRLRAELHAAGWEMEDRADGYALKRRPGGSRVKLATRDDGTRDGQLVVVSRTLARCVVVPEIARTLQAALDDWTRVAPALAAIAGELDAGRLPDAHPFDAQKARAPLPRAYQWADGSAYVNHVELVRRARGATMPPEFWTDPLMYQGASDRMLGACEDIVLADEAWGIDFEGEVVIVTGDVAMGTGEEEALAHVRLVMLANDVSLRNLIPAELAKGFGFLQSKPASSFSPVAVTPDELGSAWRDGRLHLPLLSHLNGELFGRPDAGVDMTFPFGRLIAHLAKSRDLVAGTIVGSGTVSNKEDGGPGRPASVGGIGYSCIAEQRTVETILEGKPRTPFLRFGDRVRLEMLDAQGRSIFGAIDQRVRAPR